MNIFTNDLSREIYETTYRAPGETKYSDTIERVAKTAASVETKEKFQEVYENFKWLLEDFKFVPGGRILSNIGIKERKKTTLFNCYTHGVADIGMEDCDSLEGIYDMLKAQALTLKSEGGYGTNFSWLRPQGAYIEGIGSRTPGPLKFMELWDKSSEIITAGSELAIGGRKKDEKNKIRKGAQMAIMNCFHPSIEEFVIAKQTPGRLTKFNMSVGIDGGFMEAVQKDANWDLIFPDTTFAKYKKEWNGNIFEWKDKGYPIIVHKTLKARELWDKIMAATYKRNEPGVLFFDIVNKLNPLAYIEHVEMTNPCQPAWAELLTRSGIKELREVGVGDEIWSVDGWTRIIKKWSTGVQRVYSYQLENSCVFNGTKNHTVFQKGERIEVDDANYIDCFQANNWNNTITEPSKVIARKYISTEEVFDLTVDNKSHSYWTQGCNVSNCAEVAMSTGVCNLGSLNLTKYIIDKNKFDFESFKKAVRLGIRFADNINDVSTTPLPEYDKSVKEKRRIGLGTFGLGSLHYILGIKFGSPDSLSLIKKIFKTKCETELVASAELGKEKGSFELFDKKKYFDTFWWKNLKISQEVKDQVEKIGCMRNSHRSMNAPTGNTAAFCNNTSSGIEPVFMREYIRWNIVSNTECGELRKRGFDFCDITFGEWKETANMKFATRGDEQILKGEFEGIKYEVDKNRGLTKANLIEDYGWKMAKSIYADNLDKMTKDGIFVTTENLTVEEHVETLALISHFTDQACSKTVNLPKNYEFEKFKDIYLNAWKNNIKGLTTYRDGTMTAVLEARNSENVSKSHIVESFAPKRPKELLCDVYMATCEKEQYYIVVGKLNLPYEVFVGLNNYRGNTVIPVNIKEGSVVKDGKGKYFLVSGENHILLTNGHVDHNRDALTRLVSANMRHGVPLNFIIEQLSKNEGDMFIFSKIIGRILKKYVKDGVRAGICPSCGGEMQYKSKCPNCPQCGYTACS